MQRSRVFVLSLFLIAITLGTARGDDIAVWHVRVEDPQHLAADDVFEVSDETGVLGVVPATVGSRANSQRLTISSVQDLVLTVTKRPSPGETVEAERVGCRKIDATLRAAKDGDILTFTFVLRANNKKCRQAGGLSVPNNFAKLALSATPADAIWAVAKPGDGKPLRGNAPASIVVRYACDQSRTVVFQRDGYLDCVRMLRFRCGGTPYFLVDGVHTDILEPGSAGAGSPVTCELTPLPIAAKKSIQ